MSVHRFIAALSCVVTLCCLVALQSSYGASAAGAETQPRGEWPLAPRPEVARGFDPPAVEWGSGHRGVDLVGSVGQRVTAALPGRVSFVGRIAGVGMVSVDHGATRTTYQPLSPAVAVGDRVGAGTVLGTLDWYGTHCLPRACLHWGLLEGDRYLDPLSLVGGPRPVRLLPLGGGAALPLGGGGVALPPVTPPQFHVPLRVITPWGRRIRSCG